MVVFAVGAWPVALTAVDRVAPVPVESVATERFLRGWGSKGNSDGQFSGQGLCLAVAASGEVFVSDLGNHRVQVFSRAGVFLRQIGRAEGSPPGRLNYPQQLAVSGRGELFVADLANRQVQVFSVDGRFLRQFGGSDSGDDRMNSLSGVAVSAAGEVFVGDYMNSRLHVFQ